MSANETIWIAPSSGGVARRSASEMLTPTLTDTSSSSWRIVSRPVSARRTRSARSIATAPSVTSWQSTMNSSPPRRATMSSGRTAVVESLGGRGQQPVADLVPERVVDVAQAVDIDHQDGDLAADLRRPAKRVGDPLERRRPVEQPGRRVVLEQVHELVRAHPLVGDVTADDADETAGARQRIVADEHGAGLRCMVGPPGRERSISPRHTPPSGSSSSCWGTWSSTSRSVERSPCLVGTRRRTAPYRRRWRRSACRRSR